MTDATNELLAKLPEIEQRAEILEPWKNTSPKLAEMLADIPYLCDAVRELHDLAYNFNFFAVRLLEESEEASECGDHCRNSCRWCGLRNAAEAFKSQLPSPPQEAREAK